MPGTPEQTAIVDAEVREVCEEAFASYQRMLDAGIAREVARIVLPLTIYSSMYVTMNARSLMNFLSLRTKHEGSHLPVVPAARDRDGGGSHGGALRAAHADHARGVQRERAGFALGLHARESARSSSLPLIADILHVRGVSAGKRRTLREMSATGGIRASLTVARRPTDPTLHVIACLRGGCRVILLRWML